MRVGYPITGALAVLIVLGGRNALPAQPQPTQQDLILAEQFFQRSDLLKAEPLFLKALPNVQGTDKRLCYDRLLSIYYRLARYDQAIRLIQDYRIWLAKVGDESRRREVLHQLGNCYLILGHYSKAEEQLKEVLRERPGLPTLSPLVKIETLFFLAKIAERLNQREQAQKLWLDAKTYMLKVLANPPEPLTWEESVSCIRKLSECCRFLNQPVEAIDRLRPLLAEHDKQKDAAGKCETLRLLAGYQVAKGDLRVAEQDLREALALSVNLDKLDRVRLGDMWLELSAILEQDTEHEKEVVKCREEAARSYETAVRGNSDRTSGHQPPEVAFWKLQRLYQDASQYQKALTLAEDRWAGESLAGSRLQAEQGILRIYLGSYPQAQTLLRKAVEDLEGQSPPNLIDLPRTLNSLAIVEQAQNNLDFANGRAEQVLALYTKYTLPDDLVLVETIGILGTCAALKGNYARAIEHFREGVSRCEKIGKSADRQRSNLLLNIALLHKSQGNLEEALRTCQQALTVYLQFAGKDTSGYACFLCALASLDAGQGNFVEAGRKAEALLNLCAQYDVKEGPLMLTGWHCQALAHLSRKEFELARASWLKARVMQEKTGNSLLPRTVNYLGLTAELEGQYQAAEVRYKEALALQNKSDHAYPANQFVTLWRLAGLLDRRGQLAEARKLLVRAIAIVEAGRLQTYGDAQQRVAYFDQFTLGFERLVDNCVRDGRTMEAFAFSARSRSRSLLDQLLAAGVDPRTTLTDPRWKSLLTKEAELRRNISAIRIHAQLLPPTGTNSPQLKNLLTELEKAQQDYSEVWREILNASPVYRVQTTSEKPDELLATLRRDVVRPGNVLLAYHIGTEHSYLMLLNGSDRSAPPEVFPLTVPAALVESLSRAKVMITKSDSDKDRSMGLQPRSLDIPRPQAVPSSDGAPKIWHLNRNWTLLLVDHHLRQITDRDFAIRGLEVVPREVSAPTPGHLLEQLTETLLPANVRERLKELAPKQLIVVPDGALHKVPLESLVLKAGSSPRYVLEELPPIVYAPSINVLALLAQRSSRPVGKQSSLLTVCNPNYPERIGRLPFTAEESKRISDHFAPEQVKMLKETEATEAALRDNLGGRQVVHLAVHGLAEEKSLNRFGGLVLTLPMNSEVASENDGFLSLQEIYTLPLQQCDLAVLSACQTNVGPQPPLEAGVTLANGFLTAGARNVLASHWNVNDASTAELMSAFFDEAMDEGPNGKSIPYALALQNARKKIRNSDKWASPIFWAPFVLIGTGEATGKEWPAVSKSEDSAPIEVGTKANPVGPPWPLLTLGLAVLLTLGTIAVVVAKSWKKSNGRLL